jgi:hypothetical protein
MNAVRVSGQTRRVGTQSWNHEGVTGTALSDKVKNGTLGQADIQCGPLNAILDATVPGLDGLKDAGKKYIAIAYGQEAEPAIGDQMFAAYILTTGPTVEHADDFVSMNMPIAGAAPGATYDKPFGTVIHADATRTATNTAKPGVDNLAASLVGGVFVYHLFSSDGLVTLKLQDCATANGTYVDVVGATSGSIDATSSPKYGHVELSHTLTIKEYVRWQIVFDVGTTATFLLGLIRA